MSLSLLYVSERMFFLYCLFGSFTKKTKQKKNEHLFLSLSLFIVLTNFSHFFSIYVLLFEPARKETKTKIFM